MRIAVLTSLYPSRVHPYEGIFAERRWRGMRERGHRVRVTQPLPWAPWPLVFGRYGDIRRMQRREERDGIPIERPRYLHLPGADRANAERFARTGVERVLAGERPDAVVLDYAWPAAAAVPELVRAGLPTVVSGRGSDVLQVAGVPALAPVLAQGLRQAGHWCAVSGHLLDAMGELAGGEGRGTLVPNGVDLGFFEPGDRSRARERLGLPRDGRLVLVVGHLIERKDPLLALEAFRRGAPADARLVFIGRGPLEPSLRRAIEQGGLGTRVELVGEKQPEQLRDWYAASDCTLLCSSREGRPNVVLESLASGRPVVATEAGGTAELLASTPELLCAGRDPGRIASVLAGVLAHPPSPASLRKSVAGLTWEASLDALEACIESALRTGAAVG